VEPTRTTARQQRALRAAAASGISTVVAATAHTLAGAGAPPWWLLATVTLLAWPSAVWLVGRRSSLARTAATVLVAQGLLHVAFAAVGTDSPQAASGHEHTTAGAALNLAAGGHLHLDAGMIAAHLLAALVTVALLTRGERILRAVARGVRRLLARPGVVAAAPTPDAVPLAVAALVPATRRFLSVLSRRGPPAFAR
jgi:hypothetical protein